MLTYFLVMVTSWKSYIQSLGARLANVFATALDPEFAARRQPHQAIIPLVKAETG
ncbi:hypothetical protein [Rhizobium leguminosarum]|uniref:hypothetical protein n=1 Tax=Rhizobium leguminosarum TaxID=384 RepID=UPI00140FD708|nr:hypothetical protein [Rhizobium leguminosarum]QIO56175.1 hypothetical protein HA463_00765 [Rhizobium leguminosarum bv. trifolii]